MSPKKENKELGTRNKELGTRIGDDIAERLLEYALQVLKIVEELPKNPAARHVRLQLARAGTSSGANYEEARGAESPEDFIHKIRVATKEQRESLYWLRIIHRSGWIRRDLTHVIGEGGELVAIFIASARTARTRLAKSSSVPDS